MNTLLRSLFIFMVAFPSCVFSLNDITIEAEDATLTGNYTVKSHDNASNSRFVDLANNSSDDGTITFTVNGVTTNGSYKLELFHFNGGTSQSIDLSVNGANATTKVLHKSNWAYQNQARSTLLTINLVSGSNTISLIAAHGTFLIDKIKVTENFKAYYVAANGDDSNTGTYWKPWKTLAKVSAAMELEANGGSFSPGDRVLFRSGDTFAGELKIKTSGTADQPITVSHYGPGESPILTGSGKISGGDYLSAVNLVNVSHVTLSHLWIKNDRQNDTRYGWNETKSFGILSQANKYGGVSRGLTFHNLKITDVYSVSLPEDFNNLKVTGLRFEADANEDDASGNTTTLIRFEDVTIRDNYFSHIGKAGVWAIHSGSYDDADWTINRNMDFVIRDNAFYQTGGSGVILSKMYNALVDNNDFDQTGYSNGTETRLAGRGSGLWTFRSKNVIAQYNRSYDVKGPKDSYGMHIDFGNEDIIFQYNFSQNSEGGFVEILGDNKRCTYRFNVSVNDGYRDHQGNTLWISGFTGEENAPIRSDSNYIYNNTIYYTKSYSPNIEIYASNTYIYNNAFMATGQASIGQEGIDIDIAQGSLRVSNNYFKGDISSQFQSRDNHKVDDAWPSFHDANSLTMEGFKLNSESPLVDAGMSFPQPPFPMAGQGIFTEVSPYPKVDPFGNGVDIENQPPNIGADNNHSSNVTTSMSHPVMNDQLFTLKSSLVQSDLVLRLNHDRGTYDINILDIKGRVVYGLDHVESKLTTVSLPSEIKNGIYLVQVMNLLNRNSQQSKFILYR